MKCKVSDVAIINQKNLSKKHSFKDIYYLDTGSITEGKITGFQKLIIGKDTIPSRAQRLVSDNTILFSTVRPRLLHYGILRKPSINTVVSTGFVTIDADENIIDPYYLYCQLIRSENIEHIASIADTAVSSYPSFNPDDLGNLEIDIIDDINEQRKISNFIRNINDKISINHNIINELEDLANTIYNYWFLQFDFPDIEGKPYRTSGGEMVWDIKVNKEIPINWKVSTLSEFGDFKNGINYEKNALQEKNVKIINVRNISSSSSILISEMLDDISLPKNETEKYFVEENDILIARSGIPGATRIMPPDTKNTIYCGFIIRYRLQDMNKQKFLYFLLKQKENTSYKQSAGTILKNINQETLKNIITVMPDDYLIENFNKKVEPIFEMQYLKLKENIELTKLRDWMLPMLMNRQLNII